MVPHFPFPVPDWLHFRNLFLNSSNPLSRFQPSNFHGYFDICDNQNVLFIYNLYPIVTPMDYLTDTGGGEMDQSQNGEVMVGPQPDPSLTTMQDADMEEDEARSEATFRFVVRDFSKLKVSSIPNQIFDSFCAHSSFVIFGNCPICLLFFYVRQW